MSSSSLAAGSAFGPWKACSASLTSTLITTPSAADEVEQPALEMHLEDRRDARRVDVEYHEVERPVVVPVERIDADDLEPVAEPVRERSGPVGIELDGSDRRVDRSMQVDGRRLPHKAAGPHVEHRVDPPQVEGRDQAAEGGLTPVDAERGPVDWLERPRDGHRSQSRRDAAACPSGHGYASGRDGDRRADPWPHRPLPRPRTRFRLARAASSMIDAERGPGARVPPPARQASSWRIAASPVGALDFPLRAEEHRRRAPTARCRSPSPRTLAATCSRGRAAAARAARSAARCRPRAGAAIALTGRAEVGTAAASPLDDPLQRDRARSGAARGMSGPGRSCWSGRRRTGGDVDGARAPAHRQRAARARRPLPRDR